MWCSGAKTKLLVIGTAQLRRSKGVGENSNIEIRVCGANVKDTKRKHTGIR